MKLLSAYETDHARVYVVEVAPAIASGVNQAASPAVTEEVRWGLDVPEADSFREMGLLYQQRGRAILPPPIRRRLPQREGRDL